MREYLTDKFLEICYAYFSLNRCNYKNKFITRLLNAPQIQIIDVKKQDLLCVMNRSVVQMIGKKKVFVRNLRISTKTIM